VNSDNYGLLLDPRAGSPGAPRLHVVDLPADLPVEDAAVALEAVFADDATARTVLLLVGDHEVGVSSRERLIDLGSAVLRSPGDGDGATLPGSSLRYRILRYRCPKCAAVVRRIHVDSRDAPRCPNGHGQLELER
jgi:hypothetical protein